MSALKNRCGMRRVRGRSGQALVEFVLILPILLLLIFGLVDFARAWSAHHTIADAAREGARMLVVANPDVDADSARSAINVRLQNASLNPAMATIVFDPPNGDAGRDNPQTVTIDYEYEFWVVGAFLGWATGDRNINLVSTITMRGE